MILREFSFFLLIAVCDFTKYSLIFEKESSPPHSVPVNPLDMYYSVPLNQTISKSIILYLRETNRRVTEGAMSNAIFNIQSIDAETARRGKSWIDKWATSGGKLCQRSIWWDDYPRKMDRSQAKDRCGISPNGTTLTVQAFKGKIIIDWLYHSHSFIPAGYRILRITSKKLKVSIDSYAFKIFEPANKLVVISQPPLKIEANRDFIVTAEIRDKNNKRVVDGLDSIAYVELTVPYYYKTFYKTEGKEMLVKTSSVRLSGESVTMHQSTFDLISRQRASGGIVNFTKIRILDVVNVIKLNLTMTMARDPWIRIPICKECYEDTKDYYINADGTEISFQQRSSFKDLKSIAFTNIFRVTEQKLKFLEFSESTKHLWNRLIKNGTIRVTRNIIVSRNIVLLALDDQKSIIYSGKDANFYLEYQTKPKGVCITTDSSKHFTGGRMYIYFSVCQIINRVEIRISTRNGSIYVDVPPMEVGGSINVIHFGNFASSGTGTQIDVQVDNFIKFALKDVNQGFQSKPLAKHFGVKFWLKSFSSQKHINQAYSELHKEAREDRDPADMPHVVISSLTEDVTNNLNPEINKFQLPYISVANTADFYTNKDIYPFFSRVCWSDSTIMKSVLMAVKQRRWTKITLVRSDNAQISDTVRGLAADMGIDIEDEVKIKDLSKGPEYFTRDIRLEKQMKMIKSFGSKIIFLFADGINQQYILRAAYLSGIASGDGYQWVLISKYAWQFPFQNQGVCSKGPKTCTSAFEGTVLFSESYNVSGYVTPEWKRAIGMYYSSDRYLLLGGRSTYRTPEIGGKIALGYDAIILFANALLELLNNDKTVTGKALVENLRKIEVNGLTGMIHLNKVGDRTGYLGFIGQVRKEDPNHPNENNFVAVRLLTIKGHTQYEIPYQMSINGSHGKHGFNLIPSKKYNIRKFTSFSGYIFAKNQMHLPSQGEDWPPKIIKREEKVIPSFYCIKPCGKKLLSDENVNLYDTGECIGQEICSCHMGYTGDTCKMITCDCNQGICIAVGVCKCFPGWKGSTCDIAICSDCKHGKCVEPGTCQCNSNTWIGNNCGIHIAAILAPTLVFSFLLIFAMICCAIRLIRRARHNTMLSKRDWVVDWSIVTEPRTSQLSLVSRSTLQTHIWKNENWYVKFFDNKTISSEDEDVCMEMLELTRLRHRNLIIYGGACLTSPNVSLFLEPAAKESLNDILRDENVKLEWDFKYSFMRDICSGMEFLHEKTNFKSHGRLKSHNCLVDAHWTIRISGFGAPTIRYGKYCNDALEEGMPNELLWTAPELLQQAKRLDDVKKGTQAGDVYSFAIVLCEIITRAEPYKYEQDAVDVSELVDLISKQHYGELKEARRRWEDIGGSDLLVVRPILKEKLLPEDGPTKIKLIKFLEEAWHENSLSRPTFETLTNQLSVIFPVKGELMDNLIKLLETYSNNLEMLVIERTEELEANKARAEELLRQMLPANVISELKHGRQVIPEQYECATVFFSDIVDFQSICQKSTPLQIVSMLNETYNAFDQVLDEYDVYKVETISDSYIVVSGVPKKNGDLHAGEICTMALDLMSIVTTFIIPHRTKATLQLRIGINSGPLVAGVVGVLMPRYCLFGDTVNTASRMMTSSHALCIQISDQTAEILVGLTGYHMECRGARQVKGRGLMTTYWLWGKEDFDKILPDQELAVSTSKHKFK